MEAPVLERPWEELEAHIAADDQQQILGFLDTLTPQDTALAVSRLEPESLHRMLLLLTPVEASEVLEDVSDAQAADIIDDLPPEQAAAILHELESDHVADLLGELGEDEAQQIIERMAPKEAEEARQFLSYAADTAGGLMISEYLDYRHDQTVQDVLDDFQSHREVYADYNVQYLYVTDADGKLEGVLRMRDLLFPQRTTRLSALMIRNPHRITDTSSLEELRNFFEEQNLSGVPVVDAEKRMVGVVLPQAVEEAEQEKSTRQFLGLSGIIGGEEFRSMPLLSRSGRRLSWLSLNIVLNIIAASV